MGENVKRKMVKFSGKTSISMICFIFLHLCQGYAFNLQTAGFRPQAVGILDRCSSMSAVKAVSHSRISLRMTASSPSNSLLSVFCPLLKLLGDSDPTKPRNVALETATSGFASLSRLPWGSEVSPQAAARTSIPNKSIRLYEFEACPFCRRVRETITFLDLQVEVIPCPKGSTVHRSEVLPLFRFPCSNAGHPLNCQ